MNHGAHVIVHGDELVDARASAVAAAGIGARPVQGHRAVLRVQIEEATLVFARVEGLAGLRVQDAHQALGQHADEARGEQKGLDTHVPQARDGTDRGVGVERGEHQMSGQARLYGDLGGLEVADLADHHDVGILAQDGAQAAREGHFDLGVDLRLADAVDVILDRILDGHHVAGVVVDPLERGVKRGRFARAGGAGDQNDAVRLVDDLIHQRLRPRIHAERGELDASRLLVEQSQHHALAMPGGQGGDANVDGASGDAKRDASVLRQAALGDVELRHHFDARYHERRHRAFRLEHLAQHPVDPEADHQAVLVRLDVDVRGIFLDGLRQERIDQPDDGRFIVALEQVGRLRNVLGQVREIGVVVEPLEHLHGGARARLIGDAQERVEDLDRDALELQRHPHEAAHFGQRLRRDAGPAHRIGMIVRDSANQHAVTLGERKREFPRLRPILDLGAHCGGECVGCGAGAGCGCGAIEAGGAGCGAGAG